MTTDVATWTPKPWGGELLLRRTDTYVVKVLHLHAGCRTSLQYHRVKRETMHLGSGRAFLELHRDGFVEEDSLAMPVEILPGTVHRLVALEECEVVEVSTTELDDVVRVADDYGRVDVTCAVP
jgi:mannose-6-phosphate isomerase